MSAAAAARVAADLGVKRLILTHLAPSSEDRLVLEEARAAAPGLAVELAAEGMRYEVAG